ncbi:MAG: chromosome segregation protein SMC [Candidatus Micrarchaeota archaeon]|nr:chromosome segregation protein SMC [Candidatus Micrarchaeota archaeon]
MEFEVQRPNHYISKIKFRGFKSFKNADIELPKGFVALVGPNGSGKSNVADGIRFCLGEMATKSIRVKRASELINHDCKKGEVSIIISSEDKKESLEVSRIIYEDGKSEYYINGKITTRTNLLELLRKYNFEVGAHNIIAQGQIEKIVDMHPKERREIIDQIAGIAEFEEKKKEAINELNQVEIKISEAKVLSAEKESYLKELEKEKEAALEYQEKKQQLDSARATLVWQEYNKIQNQFDENIKLKAALTKNIENIEQELKKLKESREEKEQQKASLAQSIEKIGKREGLLSQIQQLNINMAQKETLLREKEEQLKALEQITKGFENEKKEVMIKIDTINTQLKQKERYKSELEGEINKLKQIKQIEQSEENVDKINQKLIELKERLAVLTTKKEGQIKLIEHDKEILDGLEKEVENIKNKQQKTSITELKEKIEIINQQLSELFEEEKEINKKIPEFDRKLLEEKEKLATANAAINATTKNLALEIVEQFKEKESGVYGTVAELISSEEKFQVAIEAAAGSRLAYVVVETLDVATKIIEKLKQTKSGRCSFIPLDYIQFQKNDKLPPGAYGWLNEFIQYPEQIDKAIRYLFGDTLLVQDIKTAKKIGINKYRMVTLEGELIEKSGVVSGGAKTTSFMLQSKIKKLEQEVQAIKEQRDELYARLYRIREQSQDLRKERISLELKVREIEAEIGSEKEREKRLQSLIEDIEKYKNNIKKNESELTALEKEIEKTVLELQTTTTNLNNLKASEKKIKEEKIKLEEEKQKQYQQKMEQYSQLNSEIQTAKNELNLLNQRLQKIKEEIENSEEKQKQLNNTINELKKEIEQIKQEIEKAEQAIADFSEKIQKEYLKMQQIEESIKSIAFLEGQKKYEYDKLQKQLQEIEVKQAAVQTKLVDLKAEYEKYVSIKILENVSKSQLEEMINQAEKRIIELGLVNLKAPQIYEEKKQEYQELVQKLSKLEVEKTGVMTLIKEIETKKVKLFMEAFNEINKHFQKLFSLVFKGEGTLYLEDQTNPFESGLNIKIREEGRKKEKYLESLSGGEKSLLALLFIFALEMKKTAPFYILDEAEASLDKENAKKMAEFISKMAKNTQFIVITHNDTIIQHADVILGVTRDKEGSKIVGVKLSEIEQYNAIGK